MTQIPPKLRAVPGGRITDEASGDECITPDELDRFMRDDLKRSGLDEQDVRRMQVEPVSAPRFGYRLPYFSPTGERLSEKSDRIRCRPNSRDPKAPRYIQSPNSICRFYLAPLGEIDWPTIVADASIPLIVTEGEKKGALACKLKLPTIALGGAWSFSAKGAGLSAIPDFKLFEWKNREATIAFDSDADENRSVLTARNRLAIVLFELGAKPYFVSLPALDGRKTGLDDFLLSKGRAAFEALPRETFEGTEEILAIDRAFAVLDTPPAILRLDDRRLIRRSDFLDILTADRRVTTLDGRSEPAGKRWLQWRHRQRYAALAYEPGQPAVLDDGRVNRWATSGIDPRRPKPGELRDFHQLEEHIFKREPGLLPWFRQWGAHPIQNPGAKLATGTIIVSTEQGVGKSLLAELIASMYGRNARHVESRDLGSVFNASWAADVEFVIADEILGGDRRSQGDELKNHITSPTITINQKYLPAYTVRNCINYLFTSNHPDALPIPDGDRRFFVLRAPEAKLPQELYNRLGQWLRSGDAAACLLWYFTHDVDCSEFDPRAPAPMTEAKREMAYHGDSPVRRWVREWLVEPTVVTKTTAVVDKPFPGDLLTAGDLTAIHNADVHESRFMTTAPVMGRTLAELRVPQHHLTHVPKSPRLYAIRNAEAWVRRRGEKTQTWEWRLHDHYLANYGAREPKC